MATKLKAGDILIVQIVDKVNCYDFIASYQGHLIRVRNESLMPLKPNDQIQVRVVTVNPLAFQICVGANGIKINPNKFDRTI